QGLLTLACESRSRGVAVQFQPSQCARSPEGKIRLIALGLIVLWAALLIAASRQGHWLWDAALRPIATDFVNVYAAGTLALRGHAASAYDWSVHKQAEIAAVGYDFGGYLGWHYPPIFLLVAAPLALLPLVPAMLAWLSATFAAYLAAIRGITRDVTGTLLAIAFPAVLW